MPEVAVGTVSVLVLAAIVGCAVLLLRTREGVLDAGPRLSPDLPSALLVRAGFPATDHNVRAVRARLATVFVAEVRGSRPDLRAAVEAAAGAPATARPQRVLDAIAEVDPSFAAALASRVPESLLASAGTGSGFLGGSVFAPLPVDGLVAAPVSPVSVPGQRATSPALSAPGVVLV